MKKTATPEEIRRAYRRLARKHHPDVNPGNAQAAEKFKEISAANDVLSDEKKRKAYDEFGEVALRAGFDPEQARAYRAAAEAQAQAHTRAPRGASHFDENEGGYDFDLGDLFGGMGGMGGGATARGPVPGEDVIARVDLDFADALRGTQLSVDAPSGKPCHTCHGSGTSNQTCPTCHGSGRVQAAQGPMRLARPCPTCHGLGKLPCPTCHGAGVEPGARTVTVRIPPGADDGSRLRVPGLGRPGLRGGPPGDLYIETHVRPHPWFRRDGLDLTVKLPITVDEAYLGATVPVPTPGGTVSLKVPPRSQSGQRLRLRGRGVTKDGASGDLYAELDVRLPDREDAAFAEAVKRSQELYDKPVREGLRL